MPQIGLQVYDVVQGTATALTDHSTVTATFPLPMSPTSATSDGGAAKAAKSFSDVKLQWRSSSDGVDVSRKGACGMLGASCYGFAGAGEDCCDGDNYFNGGGGFHCGKCC